MRRRHIAVGLMTALVFSAAPLAGTAGGAEYIDETYVLDVPSGPISQQKCAVVKDAGNGRVTVKKNKADPGTTVRLASGDTIVVCLDVNADVAAKAQLTVLANVTVGTDVQCDGTGTPFALIVATDVAVEPGFSADASLSATVHANAGVGNDSIRAKVTTGKVSYGVGNGADEVVPELGAEADYCKTVALTEELPPDPDPDPDPEPSPEHPCQYDPFWQGPCPPAPAQA